MKKKDIDKLFGNLPQCAIDYIQLVIKKMRYRKKIRADVQSELISHFEDALRNCQGVEDKERVARELIAEFGDAKMLGKLARRAKKRCRPIWLKAIIRSLQFIGICILYIIICSSSLFIGKPTISTNYVDWLNDLVRAGRDESDNAREYYQKAGRLVVDMPNWLGESDAKWPSDFNGTELVKLESWLTENEEAFEALRKAADKPYYWNVYDANESDLMKLDIFKSGQFSKYRKLAQAMNWQIKYEAYNGKVADSIRDSICMYRFSHRMRGTGLLIEQLVGISIEAMAYAEIFDILDKTAVSAEQLEKLQETLRAGRNDAIINMEAEKAMFYDLIQRKFTDDGKGGGRPIREGSGFAGKNPGEIIFNILRFNLPDRKEVVAQIDRIYEYYQQCFETADFEGIKQQFNQAIESSPMLVKILTPAIEKVAKMSWRLRTYNDGLIATIAILRYKEERGRHPESLDELLQEGFIQEMPFDFYRGGPLTYRIIEDNFILYSFGQDFDDDGGMPSKWGSGKEGGDQIFWPIEK